MLGKVFVRTVDEFASKMVICYTGWSEYTWRKKRIYLYEEKICFHCTAVQLSEYVFVESFVDCLKRPCHVYKISFTVKSQAYHPLFVWWAVHL